MDKSKCSGLQPEPGQTLQQAADLFFDGWDAARGDLPSDPTMPKAWVEGWELFNSTAVQTKMLRLGLLQ